jgi:hypothetical protein
MDIARHWHYLSVFVHLATSRLFQAPEPFLLTILLENLKWLGRGLCAERIPFMLQSATRVLLVYGLRTIKVAEKRNAPLVIHSSSVRISQSRIQTERLLTPICRTVRGSSLYVEVFPSRNEVTSSPKKLDGTAEDLGETPNRQLVGLVPSTCSSWRWCSSRLGHVEIAHGLFEPQS